eukprot:60307-Hanusia_phi.AAC.1
MERIVSLIPSQLEITKDMVAGVFIFTVAGIFIALVLGVSPFPTPSTTADYLQILQGMAAGRFKLLYQSFVTCEEIPLEDEEEEEEEEEEEKVLRPCQGMGDGFEKEGEAKLEGGNREEVKPVYGEDKGESVEECMKTKPSVRLGHVTILLPCLLAFPLNFQTALLDNQKHRRNSIAEGIIKSDHEGLCEGLTEVEELEQDREGRREEGDNDR